MASKKTLSANAKKPIAEIRAEYDGLLAELEKLKDGAYCYMCDCKKPKSKFYANTNLLVKSGITPICKDCAHKIVYRTDAGGHDHEPTKESIIRALRYLDKPFIESLYDASVRESLDETILQKKSDPWNAYIKNIAMKQYNGMTFEDSDMFRPEFKKYEDEITEEDLKSKNIVMYEEFVKNKADIIRLLGYDPFEAENYSEQPLLYSNLIGLLDSSEDANDDMLRTSSAIVIVRSLLQLSKIDDMVAALMTDTMNITSNAATIKSLEDMKNKITQTISKMAEDNCISLKHSKNTKKGENTWTGKIKKIKDLNLREGWVNGFDIGTCRGMRQVMDASNQSILKALRLDESEYSDMLAEMREKIVKLQSDLNIYMEISRVLLQENIDLKDTLKDNNLLNEKDLVNLDALYSKFVGEGGVDNE